MSIKKVIIPLILILVVVLLTPFIIGYQFKTIYYQQVQLLQDRLLADNKLDLNVVSYQLGWFSSRAVVSITPKIDLKNQTYLQPTTVYFESTIHHGPIVKNSLGTGVTLAYANVTTKLSLTPTPSDTQSVMITSVVPFDKGIWNNHYAIAPQAVPFTVGGTWSGLLGDLVINAKDLNALSLSGAFVIGEVNIPFDRSSPYMPHVRISPMVYTFDGSQGANKIWSGRVSISLSDFLVMWPNQDKFILEGFKLNFSHAPQGEFYNYAQDLTIDRLQLPAPYSETMSVNQEILSIQHLSTKGIVELIKSKESTPFYFRNNQDDLLKLLTPSTAASFNLIIKTAAGNATATVDATLKSMPTNIADFYKSTVTTIHLQVSKAIIDAELAKMKKAMNVTDQAPTPEDLMLADLLNQGLVILKDKDYVSDIKINGENMVINGKDVTGKLEDMMKHVQQAGDAAMSPQVAQMYVSAMTMSLNTIVDETDNMAQATGSYITGQVNDAALKANNPLVMKTPWNAKMIIGNVTATSFTLTVPAVPIRVCSLLQSKIMSDGLFSVSSACDVAQPTDMVLIRMLKPSAAVPVSVPANAPVSPPVGGSAPEGVPATRGN